MYTIRNTSKDVKEENSKGIIFHINASHYSIINRICIELSINEEE